MFNIRMQFKGIHGQLVIISNVRVTLWEERLSALSPAARMELSTREELPAGADSSWAEWKCINRLRSCFGRAKVTLVK